MSAVETQNLQCEGYQDGISAAVMALLCQNSQIVSTIVIYWNYFNKNTLASEHLMVMMLMGLAWQIVI